MSGQSRKKVIVHRFDKTPLAGFCDPPGGIIDQAVDVLSPDGAVHSIPLADIKVVCFVKDFDGSGFDQEQRTFRNRPKTEGLWVRMHFLDNDFLEGIAANNLLQHEAAGVTITPPEASSNITKIFAPKSAMRHCKVLGVVGASAARRKKPVPAGQPRLFD